MLVSTDAGIAGLGDAHGDQSLMTCVVERLKSVAIGLDPLDIDLLWKKLYERAFVWEPGGSCVCAISAVEMACWDIWGKAERCPVSELLGGAKRTWIKAYASDLHWDSASHMASEAKKYVDRGFEAVKTHIGAEADEDLRRLEAIRSAIGSGTKLMIDLNTGLEREEAARRIDGYIPFAPFWVEEPIMPYDVDGHAWLRNRVSVPIAVGENLYTTHGFAAMLAGRGCDYVMPDVARSGGIRQTELVLRLAEANRVKCSPHNFSTGVRLAATLHVMAANPAMDWLEYDPTGTAICDELFVEPPVVKDGSVSVPTSPGLGVRLNDEVLRKYSA